VEAEDSIRTDPDERGASSAEEAEHSIRGRRRSGPGADAVEPE
jgi:hypothetical protein